jgi:phosphatidylserine/phosphatidylglycerophosphate/cardiolipin synthase-like enzyme
MAKKSSASGSKSSGGTSLLSTLLGAAFVVIAAIVAFLSGGFSDDNPNDGTPIAVITQATLPPSSVSLSPNVQLVALEQGYGASKSFWQIYFTAPTGSRDVSTYRGGIDTALAAAIDGVQFTLDIAAFEWNSRALTDAVLRAHERGVRVRMAIDNEHTIEDEDSTIRELIDAGIPAVSDQRSAFMHNKFMILDRRVVWAGSTNYTVNDVYRNNNNMIVLRSQRAVEAYQNEFNEMFDNRQFGPRGSRNNSVSFTQDGVAIQILFGPGDNTEATIIDTLRTAEAQIRFMAFSFTLDEVERVLLEQAAAGVIVEGIFELRGSETEFSALPPLLCAGLNVYQDGNPATFHHKVFIIDDHTVITGSYNFSANARDDNDENLIIIREPDIAALYIQEYDRMRTRAVRPDDIPCN